MNDSRKKLAQREWMVILMFFLLLLSLGIVAKINRGASDRMVRKVVGESL